MRTKARQKEKLKSITKRPWEGSKTGDGSVSSPLRQGTVLCLTDLQDRGRFSVLTEDRGRFSVLTKGIRYAILKQGDVICQEEHESNQKPAFIM